MKIKDIPVHKRSILQEMIVTKNDRSKVIIGGNIYFENMGQTLVWLDEHFVLLPGEARKFQDLENGALAHSFNIKFLPLPAGYDVPAVAEPIVYAGNRLHISTISRKNYK